MNHDTFKEYVMSHCHAVRDFRRRAVVYQRLKQATSQRDAKMSDKAVDAMVERFVCSAYCNLKRYIKEEDQDSRQAWITFIEQQDVLASLEVSASQIVLHDE
ncbi:hypothetical protein FEI15_00380 [Lacticaseibacillus zeae]|uniref:Uncharacterized protein n=1 Tax=Lacticaseibacillus zeae TaxID=57037 RepID=A0A5R8LWL7_LACZE|nr:hypothetical protein [Lacticaseibacillus zeae]TLF41705.1 hypothetical protein FEI15_00380 [Lacticaseibacillus zeae]